MFVIQILSRLPFWILYLISDFLFFVSYYVVRYRRKMVWKNLKNSFPEKKTDELRAVEKAFYKNLCDYAVETLKLITLSKEELAKRMVYVHSPEIHSYKEKNQSILVLAAHQFNWEWLVAASDFGL